MTKIDAAAAARDKGQQQAHSAVTHQSTEDEYLRTLSVDLASSSGATLRPEN